MTQGKVLVASNRLPFSFDVRDGVVVSRPSPGGLVSALTPVLEQRGGTWVGWPGGELPVGEIQGVGHDVLPLALSPDEHAGYYQGFSNGTLWPLLHSLVDRVHFEAEEWQTYQRVNARFADAIVGAAPGHDLIWIHDYHLLTAPASVRRALPDARLAFFLHIPFPPFDVLRLLPRDRTLLRCLLACDLIGFHVDSYVSNFLDCVSRLLGLRVDRVEGLIEYGDRTVKVRAFPLGIDFARFAELAEAAPPAPETGCRTILGVDRLDYTKGIPERLRAFERLLEQRPEHRGAVQLLQLAVPSRTRVDEYQQLKREIDEAVGRINGRFATPDWVPIHYLYRSLPQAELAGLYRDAEVGLVTPLRDGMNLVAKEFCAAQVGEPGVLVLSRTAGAADTMREALLVNPYDVESVAVALDRALTMDEDQRRSRMAGLRHRERDRDVYAWVDDFLGAAAEDAHELAPLGDADFAAWLAPYLARRPRTFLLLDYDGTLAPLAPTPEAATLPPETRAVLERCVAHPQLDVAVVSGRALADVRAMVGIDGIYVAGNHGLEIEGPGLEPFRFDGLDAYQEPLEAVSRALDDLAEQGAFLERKGPTLTFHVRAVPQAAQAELLDRARALIEQAGLIARDAHCAVEARPPVTWDKGRAVLHILRSAYGLDWSNQLRAVYAGDDLTDEDAFRRLAGLGLTIRIGPSPTTAAQHTLRNPPALRTLLDWIARTR